MTPVDQEFVHKPEEGQFGDCQRAVLATLLDLPIQQVPHFNQIAQGDPTIFWESLQAFCRPQGYVYLTVAKNAGSAFFGDEGQIFHEISGPSPRGNGVSHAVVGCNGEIVFDPHPSRAGLAGNPAEWHHAYLVRAGSPVPLPTPVAYRWKNCLGEPVTEWLEYKASQEAFIQGQVKAEGGTLEYAYGADDVQGCAV